jgi:hypothetical protein
MSLNSMVQRMILEVPGVVSSYAKTLLNESLGIIYDSQMWSFQLQTAGWLTPGLLFPAGPGNSVGTITTTPYQNTVVGNAAASAQWLPYIMASNLPLFTQLQIRSPYYSLYNIISYNITNPNAVVLTLDRPWMEPGGTGQTYMIYEAYFAVPVPDFKRFLSARDTTNNYPMDYWTKSQKDLSVEDPERTIFDDPDYFVPFQQDQRPNSATLGNMLYELWPHPLSVLPYTYQFLRRGAFLQNPGDTVPYPLTEEAVLWRAKECAFVFKESQKGEEMQRGSGADWRYLAGAAQEQFKIAMKPIKDRDRDMVELYFNTFCRDSVPNASEGYATITGSVNIGSF